MQDARRGVAAIVLAAGGSRRMGRPKLLLPIDGVPMVRRVAETVCAAGLGQIVVVTGAAAEELRGALAGLALSVVHNPDWAEGMSTSLRAGIGALEPGMRAALVVLADQPGLSTGLIDRLVAHYLGTGAAAVAPVYRGRRGHPVLFDRSLFPEMLRLEGDQGARPILNRPGAGLACVDVDDAGAVQDIDTWEEYTKARDGTASGW